MQLNPYLFFNGNCEEAFKFYERVLDGKIETVHRYGGSPAEAHIPPGWGDKIMHIHLSVEDQALMGSDAPPDRADKATGGYSVSLSLTDIVRAERIFRGLAENGTVKMEFQKTFWAERFGMLTDRFGVPWMINCEKAA
ncbi:MAG: VOC family protein [Acidobacteriaceae bacterium]